MDKRQKIYYALIDLPITGSLESCEEIKKLSISDRMDNILQHPRILMPRNCINIPDNWLELEIFDLIKYPLNLDRFELYNEQNKRVCICKFVNDYEKKYRLNGYFSRPIFCNCHSKIFGSMRYHSTIEKEQCKKLSIEDQMDNLVISDIPKTTDESYEIVKGERLPLRHSPAAHVLTNNDLDDGEEDGIDGNSGSGNNGGQSV